MAHAMEITPDARTPCTCTCMALSTHHLAGTGRNDHAAGSHAISSWIRSSALPLARMHCRAPVTVCLSIVRPFCGSGRVWKWYRAREWLALRDSGSSETACGGACHLGGGAASRVRKVVVSGRGMVRVVAECAAKLGNLSHSRCADHGKLLLSASRFNVVAIIIPPENVPASARGLSVDAVVVSTFVVSKA